MSLKKNYFSEGKIEEKVNFFDDGGHIRKKSEEETTLDRSTQLKNSLDDYGVNYLKETDDGTSKTLLKEFGTLPLTYTKSNEEEVKVFIYLKILFFYFFYLFYIFYFFMRPIIMLFWHIIIYFSQLNLKQLN